MIKYLTTFFLVFMPVLSAAAQKKITQNNTLDTVIQLKEAVVSKKKHYTRRNNPAVELIRRVIENKDENRIEKAAPFCAKLYEKHVLALDYDEKDILMRHIQFAKKYVDTSAFSGTPVVDLSVREILALRYHKNNPDMSKTVIQARRHEGLDRSFDINGTLTANIDEIMRDVDIFDNDIALLINRFVSPLSSVMATVYYHYFIVDTVDIEGSRFVNLSFVPASPQNYGFSGYLCISLDGRYAVKKAVLNVSRHINLNWVDKIRIEQNFTETEIGRYGLQEEILDISFRPIENTPRLYLHKIRRLDDYRLLAAESDSVFQFDNYLEIQEFADKRDDSFWAQNRPVTLSEFENKTALMIQELKSLPLFRFVLKSAEILAMDYVATHSDNRRSKFDFGPLHATFGANSIEGFRIRAGGATTANLHPHLFAGGYAAYGFKDEKWKYQGKLTYSLNRNKYHDNEMPANKLSLMHSFDIFIPGQNFLTDRDNIFAINTGKPEKRMQYVRRTVLQYEKEWHNHFSLTFAANHGESMPAGELQYRRFTSATDFTTVEQITQSELGVLLRYAPAEKPFNSREGRSSAFNFAKDALILKLSHQVGFKNFIGGDYNCHHTEASINKRIWLSSFGYIDAYVHAGKVWNRVPFPLLVLPSTNNTITISSETFMLMRAMEFISDEYASFFLTYYMKGLILNRIPLVNKLKLREVLSFSGMYGKLSDRNNPELNPAGLFQLPENTGPFGRDPYMEASVGIENILKILRIDYFRRLTYTDAPEISRHGFRIAFRFSF